MNFHLVYAIKNPVKSQYLLNSSSNAYLQRASSSFVGAIIFFGNKYGSVFFVLLLNWRCLEPTY